MGHCTEHLAVIKGHDKYLFELEGGTELFFDLKKDPHEKENLIVTSEYQTRINACRDLLVNYALKHHPKWIQDGKLKSQSPAMTEQEVLEKMAWPGFHSIYEEVDVLH